MQVKLNLATTLTLLGVNGIAFALLGFLMTYITSGVFAGTTLLCSFFFLAGIMLLRDQVAHQIKN